MKYLKKPFIRILVSLFAGSFISEVIYMSSGNPDAKRSNPIMFISAIIIYGILTSFVKDYGNWNKKLK